MAEDGTLDLTPEEFAATVDRIRREVQRVIVGHQELIDQVLVALLAGGHVLLEGVPGLGKTLLVKTVAQTLALRFSRIQFTPDLMPADIVGTTVVMQDAEGRRYFEFQRGPIFTQVLLADEINRATPKTQSALLEAMQEHAVTVGGTSYPLEEPFFVLATQNPIEMEGTYPLPEAQLDRFLFKLRAEFPGVDDLVEIIDRTTSASLPAVEVVASAPRLRAMMRLVRQVEVASHVKAYAARLVRATHPHTAGSSLARRYVRYGSSPRGAQALILAGKVRALMAGRANVAFADIHALALPALRHRIILNFEGEAEGIDPDTVVRNVLEETPTREGARA
ncbi:MAG: MoxR family ATPase [Armatimonadota bacterium]|nr:MoxR family ATPase [Armatimonadota bacterium]MDR7437036.1 MoxR family ATPase [Armatimonadota bacterium]MDR7472893.1 MoxR family ATPase [Armatimonadota bacterium]MDR7507217.1 MoxR family ATPase [Armatimonadota bacterium]MDR7508922.1 MoxR family ATPase [Armatimonadota bacterium]